MKKEIITLNQDFINDFSEIYSKPAKVNKYLKKYSDRIEKNIKSKFIELGLDQDFAIYANGGFGRKEMFPISDVDLSIIEINKVDSFKNLESFISFMWDQGYKIGHSVRSVKDVKKISRKDLKEFTSYLTRRPIISNQDIDKRIKLSLDNPLSQLK